MDYKDIATYLTTQGVNLLRGILVLVIGLFLVHWIIKLLERNQKFVKIEPTLKGFLDNLIRIVLYAIVILTAASVMGIPLTSFLTIIASAGVAISLAMQGALSNLVGGFMLLLLKPIKANEYIKVGDNEGTVKKIGAFYTELATPDNRFITIPNGTLTNTSIINNTRLGKRRLDVTFEVSYGTDIAHARKVLEALIEGNEMVIDDPKPAVLFTQCKDSSLTMVIRVWVTNENYWPLSFYLLENGKKALDQAGIEIPFPQMDVHIKQQ